MVEQLAKESQTLLRIQNTTVNNMKELVVSVQDIPTKNSSLATASDLLVLEELNQGSPDAEKNFTGFI